MAYRTVHLWGKPRRVEGLASTGTIYPGHLVEMTSAALDTWKLRATAGGKNENAVAIEDDLKGNPIATAYTANNRIQVNIYGSGDECVVRVANGEAIAKGDKLIANSDGTVKEATPDSSGVVIEQHVIGIALEACDMSGSSAVDPSPLCAMRWI